MSVLGMVLPALMPAVADGLKGLFQRFFRGEKPVTAAEQIELMRAETEKLRAIASLDRPSENISPWVSNLRASFRYIAAGLIITGTLLFTLIYFWMSHESPEGKALPAALGVLELFLELSASVFSFMFGDRVYLRLKAGGHR
ncbi:MAG: hypothetical protein Q8J64_03945 [Thermodesulfovibrionales bacterium]|nr:hypothetical protein [Thermodesulfovibrionales bacterium]